MSFSYSKGLVGSSICVSLCYKSVVGSSMYVYFPTTKVK